MNWSRILFIILLTLTGFFAGFFLGVLSIPENSGLAGPAIALGYGAIGAIIALIMAIAFVRTISPVLVKRINFLLLAVLLALGGWIAFRISAKNQPASPEHQPPLKPTETALLVHPFTGNGKMRQSEMGLGVARPDFYNESKLYFYSAPNIQKPVFEHSPVDSLVFAQKDHHQYTITHAPPWFMPLHIKMDYEILWLKVISMNRDWLQVEVNQNGLTHWVARSEVEIRLWPEFLLTVNSIELKDPEKHPLRIKPMGHAALVSAPYTFLKPIEIKENWLKVALLDDKLQRLGEAWLQWKADDQMLIDYDLLH